MSTTHSHSTDCTTAPRDINLARLRAISESERRLAAAIDAAGRELPQDGTSQDGTSQDGTSQAHSQEDTFQLSPTPTTQTPGHP